MITRNFLFLFIPQSILNIVFFIQAIKYTKPAIEFNKSKLKKRGLLNFCFIIGIFSYIYYLAVLYYYLYDPSAYNLIVSANAFLYLAKTILDNKENV